MLDVTLSHQSFEDISIDRHSTVPVYQQLAGRLNCIISILQLSTGDHLPPIRKMAKTVGINPNTVARAYGELKSAGVIEKTRGSGCVVVGPQSGKNSSIATEVLNSQIDELVATAGALGIGPAELIKIIASKSTTSPKTPRPKQEAQKLTPSSKPEPVSKPSPPSTVDPAIWQPDDEFID